MALFRPDVTFRDFAYMAASSARVPMVSLRPERPLRGVCGAASLLRAEPHAAVSRRAVRVRASPRSLPRAFSSCCPASYVLGSAALQRQAGCPDPAPRSELDPCFWDAVPDASGANGRLRTA